MHVKNDSDKDDKDARNLSIITVIDPEKKNLTFDITAKFFSNHTLSSSK